MTVASGRVRKLDSMSTNLWSDSAKITLFWDLSIRRVREIMVFGIAAESEYRITFFLQKKELGKRKWKW